MRRFLKQLFLFLVLCHQVAPGGIVAGIVETVSLGLEIADLVISYEQLQVDKEKVDELREIGAGLKRVIGIEANLDEVKDLMVKLHIDNEIDVPREIVQKSIFDYLNHPDEFSRSYLDESCHRHRPLDLLLKFKNLLDDESAAFSQAVDAHGYSSKYVRLIVGKLRVMVDGISFIHGFCHRLKGHSENVTRDVFTKYFDGFEGFMKSHLQSFQANYFKKAAEKFIRNHVKINELDCEKQNSCALDLARAVKTALQEQFQYGDVYYVKVTSTEAECRPTKPSDSLIVMESHKKNVIVFRSKPHKVSLNSRVKVLRDFFKLKKEWTMFGTDYCTYIIDHQVKLKETAFDVAPYCEDYEFCLICEKSEDEGVMDEMHVHTQIHDICEYFIFGLKGVAVTYGNRVDHNQDDASMDQYYSPDNSDKLKNTSKQVKLLTSKFQLTAATAAAEKMPVSPTKSLVEQLAEQISNNIEEMLDQKLYFWQQTTGKRRHVEQQNLEELQELTVKYPVDTGGNTPGNGTVIDGEADDTNDHELQHIGDAGHPKFDFMNSASFIPPNFGSLFVFSIALLKWWIVEW